MIVGARSAPRGQCAWFTSSHPTTVDFSSDYPQNTGTSLDSAFKLASVIEDPDGPGGIDGAYRDVLVR